MAENTQAEKRYSPEEFQRAFRSNYPLEVETVTFRIDELAGNFGQACFLVQEETEARVRREMLTPSRN